jgi:hypothetical protein
MPIPAFLGDDLPPGIHKATLAEVLERFDQGSPGRTQVSRRLVHIRDLAIGTGRLSQFIIFGSYVSAKPEPNDVDIILVMQDGFELEACPPDAQALFDHALAQARYGASIFWLRPSSLILETLGEFLDYWQTKRDGTKRGIIEVVEDVP